MRNLAKKRLSSTSWPCFSYSAKCSRTSRTPRSRPYSRIHDSSLQRNTSLLWRGGEIVKHPGALEHMTENSFVFAPYLVWPAFPDTIIKTHPALYIGNNVESGGGMGIPIAERYVRKFCVTGKREMGPDLQEIIDQTKKFADSYDKYLFDATYDSLHTKYGSHFQNMWVHHPKREQHDSDNDPPGGSGAAPGPPNTKPKDDSDHGPKENGGSGFDQSNLPHRNKTDAIQGRWQP